MDLFTDEKKEANEVLSGLMEAIASQSSNISNMISKMIEGLVESNISENMAKMQRKYYEGLLESGFSEDEAMKLMLSSNPVGAILNNIKR